MAMMKCERASRMDKGCGIKHFTLAAGMLAALFCTPCTAAEPYAFTLSYRQPARNWFEAMPLGNGRLGAMAFGGVESDCLVLNEDTIWTGRPIGRGSWL